MPDTPMKDISALQVPGGNLFFLFQYLNALPALADFIVVDPDGTLKFLLCHQLKYKKIII